MRILGIDPGSRVTGYGIVDFSAGRLLYAGGGSLKLPTDTVADRLSAIYFGVGEVIERYRPNVAVVEQVFMSVNPQAALMLGQARGSAICACAAHKLEIAEYAAKLIKKTVTGTGMATKEQVQYMVKMLLNIDIPLDSDQADALAGAITHIHHAPSSALAAAEKTQCKPQRLASSSA